MEVVAALCFVMDSRLYDFSMHTREEAHQLIDRLAPSQVSAVAMLLETMLDPVAKAIALAEVDDELESDEERAAVMVSKAWVEANPGQTISHTELMAEFSLAAAETE